ncbi:hypothetical protein VTN77DRAFT_801 [Rasamsonia byssochlamydoides]|uniref:uncharacterized protein n=1 Tax=Rasamsonia byssochlamydoides TaxID=89139 RepID=UPI0037424BCB
MPKEHACEKQGAFTLYMVKYTTIRSGSGIRRPEASLALFIFDRQLGDVACRFLVVLRWSQSRHAARIGGTCDLPIPV